MPAQEAGPTSWTSHYLLHRSHVPDKPKKMFGWLANYQRASKYYCWDSIIWLNNVVSILAETTLVMKAALLHATTLLMKSTSALGTALPRRNLGSPLLKEHNSQERHAQDTVSRCWNTAALSKNAHVRWRQRCSSLKRSCRRCLQLFYP